MTTIQLKEFVRTGNFGSITLGSMKNDILNQLGGKYDFADCGETQIIRYGWYEFFYWTETEKIFGIQNDHLQADCINHNKMINFKNKFWVIDKWFLKDNQNITFGQVVELLKQENISFNIEPTYKGCNENVIKCVNSEVIFDFVNEYRFIDVNTNGKFKNWVEIIEKEQENYILNGVRLFKY
jgi:hypothetical protein